MMNYGNGEPEEIKMQDSELIQLSPHKTSLITTKPALH